MSSQGREALLGRRPDRQSDQRSNAHNGDEETEEQRLYRAAEESAARSARYLDEANANLEEAGHVGASAHAQLRDQGTTLRETNAQVLETYEIAVLSGKRLRKMARKGLYNKALLWGIIILLCVLIGVVIYYDYIKK